MSGQNHQQECLRVLGGVIAGIGILIFSHIAVFFLLFLIASITESIAVFKELGMAFAKIFNFFYLCIFVTQLTYVLPLYILFKRNRYRYVAQGIMVGAVITALISGGCFLIFMQF